MVLLVLIAAFFLDKKNNVGMIFGGVAQLVRAEES